MDKKNERIDNNDEVEINLLELFLALIHDWYKILLSAVIVGAIVFVYFSNFVTPTYTSTSILYVLSKSTSITSVADIQIGSYLTEDYVEVISGRPVLDQVIENLELDDDLTYETLSEMVSLTNPDDTRMIEITVSNEDPELAKELADEIADVAAAFIGQKMDQDEPSIIQYGYISESPSSPNVTKDTIIGVLAGAVIAIIILCIIYLTNDSIIAPDDIEKRVGIKVLASLPAEDGVSDSESSKKKKRRKKE